VSLYVSSGKLRVPFASTLPLVHRLGLIVNLPFSFVSLAKKEKKTIIKGIVTNRYNLGSGLVGLAFFRETKIK
jgi:hypothetical protein